MASDPWPHEMHALVTGGGTGIGAAIARRLAASGMKVTVLGRRREPLKQVCAESAGMAAVIADITRKEEVVAALVAARAKFGPVHVLVNNAGMAMSAPLDKISLDDWQQVLAVNLTGTFICTRAVLDDMREAGWGRVINIASTAALRGYPYVASYCAAKHGVLGLTRALALELARDGITVNAVCPGYTATELIDEALQNISSQSGRSREQAMEKLTSLNPQRRLVQPEEVADAVHWLCGAGAAAMNGQAIAVAGGEVM